MLQNFAIPLLNGICDNTFLPDCLQTMIDAHDRGAARVCGVVLNASASAIGWASYWLDHSDHLPGRGDMTLTVAPTCASMLREATHRVEASPSAVFASTARRLEPARATGPFELLRQGYGVGFEAAQLMAAHEATQRRTLGSLRSLAWAARFGRRTVSRVTRNVEQWAPAHLPQLRRARPWLVWGCLGVTVGALHGAISKSVSDRP